MRLNPEEMAALEVIAEHRGLPVSTSAREQLLRLLREDPEDSLSWLLAERITETVNQVMRTQPHRERLGPRVKARPDGRLEQIPD